MFLKAQRPHPCSRQIENQCSELCLLNSTLPYPQMGGYSKAPIYSSSGKIIRPLYHSTPKSNFPATRRGISVTQPSVGYGGSSVYDYAGVLYQQRSTTQHYLSSPAYFSEACGCVDGHVLYSNGWECGPCTSEHFTCNVDPLQCIPSKKRCDGFSHCYNGTDERNCPLLPPSECIGAGCMSHTFPVGGASPLPPSSSKTAYTVGVAVCVMVLLCLAALLVYYRRRPPLEDALAMAPTAVGLKQQQQLIQRGVNSTVKGQRGPTAGSLSSCQQRLLPDTTTCSITGLNSSCGTSGCAGAGHLISGTEMFSLSPASAAHASSSSSSTTHYPKETVNPPPTPTTREPLPSSYNAPCYHPLHAGALPRHLIHPINRRAHYYPPRGGGAPHNSYVSRAPQVIPLSGANPHSYRHYKTRNRPPPPTPCSTDVCDDSDVNSATLLTSTPSYSSDNNYHHHHPNSPNTQYCSFSSLPCTDYYCDSDPDPPPPTPQTADGRGEEDGGLLPPARAMDLFYCPPPPSPVASD